MVRDLATGTDRHLTSNDSSLATLADASDGTRETPIAGGSGRGVVAGWSPDGRGVAMAAGRDEWEIWAWENFLLTDR